MRLRDQLMQNSSLEFEGNIFYQKGFQRPSKFEEAYIALRKKENRLYDDTTVRNLPEIPEMHSLRNEWLHRKSSLKKLVAYLRNTKPGKLVLEIGCGNGWLSHQLSEELSVDVCAMDINQTELLQGGRVFSANTKVCFTCADVFSLPVDFVSFDTIVLASSIQYFPDLNKLISCLLSLVSAHGEIHVMDSPMYSTHEAARLAKQRSEQYFMSLGFPGMKANYFHHTNDALDGFNHRVLNNPNSVVSRVTSKILKRTRSVFPWIVVWK